MSMPPQVPFGAAPPQVVPHGIRAYRRAIRAAGPLWGLLPPAAMAAAGVALLRTGGSVTTGVAGFAALVVAAPGMLVAGVPLRSGTTVYALAAMGSAVLWFAVGMWASRRATAKPAATWADFWREYAALALAVVLGVVVAGVAVNLLTGRAVF